MLLSVLTAAQNAEPSLVGTGVAIDQTLALLNIAGHLHIFAGLAETGDTLCLPSDKSGLPPICTSWSRTVH